MALLSVIRRWAFRDGMSIREITRRTGLSRNTIRKYLWSDVVEPKFEMLVRAEQVGSVCRAAIRLAEDGDGQIAQATAHGQADSR